MPRVVAMAVRKEIAICKIVFQVLAFIMLNVECLMLNVDLVGGCASFRQALGRDASPVRRVLRGLASGEGFTQARHRYPESRRLPAYRRW